MASLLLSPFHNHIGAIETSEGNLILRSPMMVVIRRGNTRYFGFVREGIKISVKIDAVHILRSLRDRRPALRSADCFL